MSTLAAVRRLRWSRGLLQGWRIVAAGSSFVLFGVAGLLLGGIVLPLLLLVARDQARRQIMARRVIGAAFTLFVGVMRGLGCIRVRVSGVEGLRLPGVVISATHPTLIDVVLLLALAPQLSCVVKHSVRRNPFMAGVVRAAGYIDNDLDGPALLERCAEVIRDGGSILIFPEGTRTVPDTPVRLRRGAAAIALAARAPLVPVVMHCAPPALTKVQRWYDLPPDSLQIRIDVHPAWPSTGYLTRAPNRAIAARQMTRDLESFYRGELRAVGS